LTVSLIVPLDPAGTVHGSGGSSAVVHPQDGCTVSTVTLPAVRLVKVKKNRTICCSLVASAAFSNSSQAITPSGSGSLAWV
jgi:hypothetical protein